MCGLESINKTMLPGRQQLWCLQFGLLPRLMWPLTIYEVPISKVEKLERVVSSFAKKWLGLPRCFTNIGLYGRGILEIPISSLAEEFKCSKVRLEMTLTESRDPCVSQTAPTLVTEGNGTQLQLLTRQSQTSGTETSLALCNREEEASALERADHRGIGQLQLSADGWLSRRCVGKSRQRGVQRLSHKPSKDSG